MEEVSCLFRKEFSWLFSSYLSPSNLQQKLGTRKKEFIVELEKNLKSILVLDKITALGARWIEQKTG